MLVRPHHRRRGDRRRLRRRAARGDRADLRPGRLRRLHVHQRHGPAAGQRRVRPDARRRPTSPPRSSRSVPTCAGSCSADAEGSTKDVTVEVTGAASEADAVEVGRAVARSNLLKCALFGNDPNWGRVLAAVGTTAAAFEPDALDVAINGVQVCRGGGAGEPRDQVDLSGRAVHILVDLHAGASRRPRSGPTTSPWPTCTRTRRTRHDHHRDPRPAGRAGQGGHPGRGAALAGPFPRRGRRPQVRRQRDDRPRPAAGLRRGRRLPAVRGAPAGRRARRRPADHRPPGPARHRERVPRRAAGDHPGGHGGRPDGARRPGQRRRRPAGQRPRPVRGRAVRRGRRPAHRASGGPPWSSGEEVDLGLVGDVDRGRPGHGPGAARRRPDPGRGDGGPRRRRRAVQRQRGQRRRRARGRARRAEAGGADRRRGSVRRPGRPTAPASPATW